MAAQTDQLIHPVDVQNLASLRNHISKIKDLSRNLFDIEGLVILEIGPQEHEGLKNQFRNAVVKTLDIDPSKGPDLVLDLCNELDEQYKETFDFILCTEVLEHTKNPFHAVRTLHELLKKGGDVFVTTPFNFRIHGPLPDCWRFTEYGLRELFKFFERVEIESFESSDGRYLMPLQYFLRAQK